MTRGGRRNQEEDAVGGGKRRRRFKLTRDQTQMTDGRGELKQGINRLEHGSNRELTSSAKALNCNEVLHYSRHAPLAGLHNKRQIFYTEGNQDARHAPSSSPSS